MSYESTRKFFGIGPDDSLVAAVDAYEWVEAHPEEAPFVLRSVLFDLHAQDMEDNKELVSKIAEDYITERIGFLKPLIEKTAISKSLDGGEVQELGALHDAIEVVEKAFGSKNSNSKKNRRQWKEQYVIRDAQGQFAGWRTVSGTEPGDNKKSAGSVGYNLLSSVGAGLRATGAAGDIGNQLDSNDPFGHYWAAAARSEEIGSNQKFFNQVEASAGLAQQLAGPALGPGANIALAAGRVAAHHAPEAEKVIGPKARKAAYRYRGVEKTPDPVFQDEINNLRRAEEAAAESKGLSKEQGSTIARHKAIYGSDSGTPRNIRRTDQGERKEFVESALIEEMQKKLPSPELYELSLKSGTVPPSQGIIIDRNGRVVTEAQGYADDWYLPFNLKNLSKLQGGEYVRTRAYGGLTSEDIYTGLVSGARAVTVVSRSGVFTVEFDDDFRGTRRFNDKAARMVGRYEHLLDSLASQKVTIGSISPARRREITAEADAVADRATQNAKWKQVKEDAEAREKLSPRLAKADADKIRLEVAEKAVGNIDRGSGEDGGYASIEDYRNYKIALIGAKANRDKAENPNIADYIQRDAEIEYDSLMTAEGLIADISERTGNKRLAARAEEAVERAQMDYEHSRKPLALDAHGYTKAQEALKEQFPYYFKRDPHYRPLSDPDLRNGNWDDGYVKARHNRPEAALAGYWDTSIAGAREIKAKAADGTEVKTGKVTADRTGYQNYRQREIDKTTPEPVTDPAAQGQGTGQGQTPAGVQTPAAGVQTPAAGAQTPASGGAPGGGSSGSNLPSTPVNSAQTGAYAQAATALQAIFSNPNSAFANNTITQQSGFVVVPGKLVIPLLDASGKEIHGIAGTSVAGLLDNDIVKSSPDSLFAPLIALKNIPASELNAIANDPDHPRAQEVRDLVDKVLALGVLDVDASVTDQIKATAQDSAVTGNVPNLRRDGIPEPDQVTVFLGPGRDIDWDFGSVPTLDSPDVRNAMIKMNLRPDASVDDIDMALDRLGKEWTSAREHLARVKVDPSIRPTHSDNYSKVIKETILINNTDTNRNFSGLVGGLMKARQVQEEKYVSPPGYDKAAFEKEVMEEYRAAMAAGTGSLDSSEVAAVRMKYRWPKSGYEMEWREARGIPMAIPPGVRVPAYRPRFQRGATS